MRRVHFSPCWLSVLALSVLGLGQEPPRRGISAPNTVHVELGRSLARLNGPWKFTVGDSPTDPRWGGPLWAEPGFDDSQWETVDLTPAEGSFEPIQGIPGYVPGWTSKGHPGYWGYGWYRIRVSVEIQKPTHLDRKEYKLALEGPANFDTVYQVFANGKLLGGFGDFSGKRPVEYYNVPAFFPLRIQTETRQ